VSGAPINHTGDRIADASRPAQPGAMTAADRVLATASVAFLVVAAFAGSAGTRATLLFAAALACAMLWRRTGQALRALPRGFALAACAYALLCIASLAWTANVAYSLSELRAELLYGALAFAVFLVAAATHPSLWARWWLAAMAGAAIVLAAQGVQELVPFALASHDLDGGPGPFSTHLVLLMPLLFALAWRPPWGRAASASALTAAVALFVVAAWCTGNRIVWVAFATQLLVAIAAWKAQHEAQAVRPRTLRGLALVAAVAIAVAFAASIAERNDRIFHHPTRFTAGIEGDLRPRIWAVAWQQFAEAPWLGHGYGREIAAPAFLPLTPNVPGYPALLHGHNTLIDVALELGGIGLAAFAAMLLALLWEYRSFLAQRELAPLGIMGIALVAGFVVKNLTDDFLHRHNALVFWALNGMLLGLAQAARPRAPGGRVR
jgi:O-antigen ligase